MNTALCDGSCWRAVASIVLGAALAGCVGAPDPTIVDVADGTFVGALRTQGVDVAVGLVVHEGQASYYACGTGPTLATHTRWLAGSLDDGGALRLVGDSLQVEGALAGDSAEGSFTRDGDAALAWSAQRVPDGGVAGLYAVVDEGCRTGVVVWNDDGGAPVMQGSWCNEAGARMQSRA